MNFSVKTTLLCSMVGGLILMGCDAKSSFSDNSVSLKNDTSAVEEMSDYAQLPTDPVALQSILIEYFANDDVVRFNDAMKVYVSDVEDRGVQRDFVNKLWYGSDDIEMNRRLAVPLAEALSNAYDLYAATYLAGFAYWAGSGIDQNFGKALEFWAKPSVESNGTVHFRRAMIYLDSASLYHDVQKGREIMALAAEKGSPEGVKWLREN